MKYWALLLLAAISFNAVAGESKEKINFVDSKTYEVLRVGVPLMAAGFAFKPACDEFQHLRNSYGANAHTHVDDYLQYAPAGLMVGLKAAGVESRSSWGRMLTSDAASVVTMTLVVNGMKLATNVQRPDSKADNSFPSGHTATAFMTATMLHKEYGAVSPWYSVAGYGMATATGAMRIINNRHWVSDVLVGAGIGIITTELGYLLADLIYKDRGINKELDLYVAPTWDDISARSSVSLYMGVVTPLNKITNSATINMGSRVGVEGSYLIGKNFGVGGGVSLNDSSISVDGEMQEESLDLVAANLGAYYAQPISKRWRVGAKALAGLNYYKGCEVGEEFSIDKGGCGAFGAGFSMEYLTNHHWSIKAFGDYNAANIKGSTTSKLHQTAIFGVAGNIIF